MLAKERTLYIIKKLETDGGVEVEELAKELGVTTMTIRRDLKRLDDTGILERCHGGAIQKQEISYGKKSLVRKSEKDAIAKRAASFVKDGDCIFLDAGTTVYQILNYLGEYKNLKIVTNDIEIGYKANKMKFDVIMTGGQIQRETGCLLGMITNSALDQFKFDCAFIGAASIDDGFDVLTPTEEKAIYKRKLIKSSCASFILVDSGKFHKMSLIKINNLFEYTGVITTYHPTDEEKQKIGDMKINYIEVEV